MRTVTKDELISIPISGIKLLKECCTTLNNKIIYVRRIDFKPIAPASLWYVDIELSSNNNDDVELVKFQDSCIAIVNGCRLQGDTGKWRYEDGFFKGELEFYIGNSIFEIEARNQ